jgi:two-component system chemotaxis sensor kinase CheA
MPMDPKIYQQLLITFRDELTDNHKDLVDTLLKMESCDAANVQEHLNTVFRIAHNLKGAAMSVSLSQVATLAHELEDKFSDWRKANYKPTKNEINDSLQRADALLTTFQEIQTNSTGAGEVLKISLDKIERANIKADEFIAHRLHLENWVKTLNKVSASLTQSQKEDDQNIVDQLTVLSENAASFVDDFSQSLLALQDELRSMRLIPVSTVLAPLKRTARELADSVGKKVSLTIEGGDIEIDKTILAFLKDPLQHLLRNAIDHAIEMPEKRHKENKPEEGHIIIKIQQDAGKIKLLFSDDGRGFNVEKIKTQALKNGFISQELFSTMTNEEALLLALRPGLSTSEKVTALSGRGVGLDVVKSNLEKVKGSLKIQSELTKGTTFTLTLPLTLATTRGVLISASGHHLMLPTLSLESLHQINLSDLKPVENERVFIVNNTPIPTKSLQDLLQLPKAQVEAKSCDGFFLRDANQYYIILVDAIEDEHDCIIKPLPAPFNQMPLYIGVTLTGEGELVPVLNPKAVVDLARTTTLNNTAREKSGEAVKSVKKILVVDDSLTTRSLAVNALKGAGFDVKSAVDGKQAWETIQKEKFDCVVTDIVMPKMNGFELIKLIKSSQNFSRLPVIVVTSHESDLEKQQGVASGADFYLVKSQFNTRILIDTIWSLL